MGFRSVSYITTTWQCVRIKEPKLLIDKPAMLVEIPMSAVAEGVVNSVRVSTHFIAEGIEGVAINHVPQAIK